MSEIPIKTTTKHELEQVLENKAPPRRFSEKQPRLQRYLPTLNIGVSWTSNIILVIGSFVVTPAILHALGDRQYGVWLLVLSFIGQMRVLDMGMSSGCMRYSAAYYESGDQARLTQVFHTSVAIFGGSTVLALAATAFLALLLPWLYPAAMSGMAGVIMLLGGGLALDLCGRPYAASLRGRSMFFVYDGIEAVTYMIFKLALVLYLAHIGMSVWNLSLVTFAESVVRNGTVLVFSLKLCPWLTTPKPWLASKKMAFNLATYSSAVFLISLADVIRFQINAGIIAYNAPDSPEQISIFGIGVRLLVLMCSTIGVVWSVFIPRFSGLSEAGKTEELWALFRKANRWTGLLSVFGMVNLAVFGLPFLRLWIGKPWVGESYAVMLLAVPGYFVALLAGPSGGLLSGLGRMKGQMIVTVLEAICNISLSFLLVPHLGIFGVCLGMTIPMLLFRSLGLALVMRRDAKLPLTSYWGMHAPILLLGLIYAGLSCGFAFIQYQSFIELFIGCFMSTLVFVLLSYSTVPEVRQIIGRIWRRRETDPAL